MWGSEHFDHLLDEAKCVPIFQKIKTKTYFGRKNDIFLEITPNLDRNSLNENEQFTGLIQTEIYGQNKHEVIEEEKLRFISHLSQIIGDSC